MSTTYAFQPETVEALASAFQKSWQFLSRDPHFAAIGKAELQHQLTLCLFELAADGEHDPSKLANGAICRLRSRIHSVPQYGRPAMTASSTCAAKPRPVQHERNNKRGIGKVVRAPRSQRLMADGKDQ